VAAKKAAAAKPVLPKPKKKPRGTPWVKGVSGNPGGKAVVPREVIDLARSYTVKAINRLAFWIDCNNPRASVAACNAILDRGWGKPTQVIAGDHDNPINVSVKLDAFTGRIARLAARAAEDAGDQEA
jgi:hypothetical protein